MNNLLQAFLGDFFDTYSDFLSARSERAFYQYIVPFMDRNPMAAEK
jgi:hypothetical protein